MQVSDRNPAKCTVKSYYESILKSSSKGVQMFADYHVHTEFSDDSTYPMEDVIRDAVRMNVEEICITDHVDYGVKDDWDFGAEIIYRNGEPLANVDYPAYMDKIQSLKKKYEGKIRIKTGMEFGVQTHTIPQFETLFRRYPFDFIILSVHQVEDKEFWTQEFQKGRTQKEYNERYYEEMLSLVKHYKNYSVLGHMDLIKRYDQEGEYPFEKIKPVIEDILKIVIADGKGIEINTSAKRYGLEDTMPSKELGGEIITIGSDSHKPDQLGYGIAEAQKLLKEIGFQKICTFEKMNPVMHEL